MSKIIKIFIFLSLAHTIDIDNNLSKMSLKDKIAQMVMVRVNGEFYNDEHWRKKTVLNLINNYNIGGLISYTGSIHGTFYNLKEFQEASKIPMFIAADYERGIGQFIDGTLFPSNMALAATGNEEFAYKQGEITAKEAKAIGVNMIFAPVLDINNNLHNPIINFRSYGDNPDIVIKFSTPYIKGIQNQGIIACGKHYPGHGDTDTDSHTSLPIINKSMVDLMDNELLPFKNACDIGIKSIMVGHILFPNIDKDNPATFSKKITHDIVREQWKYNGLIITDALEMGALSNHTWHGESAIRAIEGGADIILLPIDAIQAINSIYDAVQSGRISEERINKSVERILNEKNNIGLLNDSISNDWNIVEKTVKIKSHTKISQKIANESITLVKNNKEIIPLDNKKYQNIIHIMLSTDDDVRSRFKSYARDIRNTHGNVEEIVVNDKLTKYGLKDILNKVKKSDLVIISMLIRIKMDKGISTIDDTHNKLINKISKLKKPIIGISFGSPYLPSYDKLDSYICTYGYGSITFKAATSAIFGKINIDGKLPVTLNTQYQSGYGIKLNAKKSAFNNHLNLKFEETVDIIQSAINDSIFPGAQVFISRGDDVLMNRGFGYLSYEKNASPVTVNSVYDIASLTKIIATAPVLMKLIEKKRLALNYPLSDFYNEYNTENKKNITIRHLLTHTSGLEAFREYYKTNDISREKIINNILQQDLLYKPDSLEKYSDLGMILLMDIIEKVTNSTLDKLARKYIYKPLAMNKTTFNPLDYNIENIAPTELDDYFRNQLLKGLVHDENAYILNGVSGHAGLFSNATDIGIYCKMLIDGGFYLGNRYFSNNLINEFTRRQNIVLDSDRALIWDTPSQNGKSSAGDYFSNNSYGHLGFTGTSVWSDPENEIIVVLLTNRVYPTRYKPNIRSKMYLFRRNFHNQIIQEIMDL